MIFLQRLLLACLVLLCLQRAALAAPGLAPLVPAQHGDFDVYNLALTWQPGFCGTAAGCLPDQPKDALIGLHGLWASLPTSLSQRGITNVEWWSKGCDYFHHSAAQPALPIAVRRQLSEVIPHVKSDLLHHEYDKHVQCFGFDTTDYFQTELAMRGQILASGFAQTLVNSVGTVVNHAALIAAFQSSFRTSAPRALQLQCESDANGRKVLSQLWITLRRAAIDSFPTSASLTNSPVPQDNCPATFLIPSW